MKCISFLNDVSVEDFLISALSLAADKSMTIEVSNNFFVGFRIKQCLQHH